MLWLAHQCRFGLRRRFNSTLAPTDALGIPLKPTWSVNELISSYPRPRLSDQTLDRLHQVAALEPPAVGTPEHAKLKGDLEELVRLVEAVKLVDTTGVQVQQWGARPDFYQATETSEDATPSGRELMKHAARVEGDFYVVDTDKARCAISTSLSVNVCNKQCVDNWIFIRRLFTRTHDHQWIQTRQRHESFPRDPTVRPSEYMDEGLSTMRLTWTSCTSGVCIFSMISCAIRSPSLTAGAFSV